MKKFPSFICLISVLAVSGLSTSAGTQSAIDRLSPGTRAEIEKLAPDKRAELARDLSPALPKAEDGNRFLCTRWGCVGGTLMGGVGDWRSTPEGTFHESNSGLTIGLDAATPIPYFQEQGLGLQLAGSYGRYDLSGECRVRSPMLFGCENSSQPQLQYYYSLGLFRRPDPFGPWYSRWGMGFAYDVSINDHAGEYGENFALRQWRLKASYDLTKAHQVGLWAAIADGNGTAETNTQTAGLVFAPVVYRSLGQVNLFYKYDLASGGHLSAYLGRGVGGVLPVVTISAPRSEAYHGLKWTMGADAVAPLSSYWALFANVAYSVPNIRPTLGGAGSSTRSYSILTGLRFYWGGNARMREDSGRHWMPYLPAPDNGNFFVHSNHLVQ